MERACASVIFGLVAVAAALVWFRVWEPIPTVSVIGVVGLLIGARHHPRVPAQRFKMRGDIEFFHAHDGYTVP